MKSINLLYLLFAGAILLLISCNNKEVEEEVKLQPYSVVKEEHKEELLDWNKEIVQIDHTVIDKFIERRKWQMETSPTGLFYQIIETSNGTKVEADKYVEFSYKTSMLNGTVLYTSEEFGNRVLHMGHNQEEHGVNEGLLMMKEGEKGRFILPPHLAYGVPGDGYKVPSYTILVYEIEVISVKDSKE